METRIRLEETIRIEQQASLSHKSAGVTQHRETKLSDRRLQNVLRLPQSLISTSAFHAAVDFVSACRLTHCGPKIFVVEHRSPPTEWTATPASSVWSNIYPSLNP